MRVIVFTKAAEDNEKGVPPTAEAYLTPEELSTPRDGERGKLGVA